MSGYYNVGEGSDAESIRAIHRAPDLGDPEAKLLPLLRELGIGFVPYSPLGNGFLIGNLRSPDDLADGDWRKTNPRFTGENFQQDLRIVDEVQAVAREANATPAQIALAWLLAQGDDSAPIPGTKRVARGEENTAADGIVLTHKQIERLNQFTSGAGFNAAGLASLSALSSRFGSL